VDKHISLAAALNLGIGIIGVLAAVFVFIIVVGSGLLSGDPYALRVTSFIGSLIAFFLIIISVPQIIGGLGLWKRRPWARILLLIVSVFQLLNVPFGTALGIYTIWVLIHDETKAIFEKQAV
jgi:hypothetical protein